MLWNLNFLLEGGCVLCLKGFDNFINAKVPAEKVVARTVCLFDFSFIFRNKLLHLKVGEKFTETKWSLGVPIVRTYECQMVVTNLIMS